MAPRVLWGRIESSTEDSIENPPHNFLAGAGIITRVRVHSVNADESSQALQHARQNQTLQEDHMAIKVGDKVPAGSFGIMKEAGPGNISSEELFSGKRVVLFSVPGAFTPTCSKTHLPGFVKNAAALKSKGIDTLACLAVNDVFVMDAWGKSASADGKVLMLADGNAAYTKALGLELDATGFGMGVRGQRFAMVVRNGVVEKLLVEPSAGQCTISGGESILNTL
jgi:peroxiredoxin